MLDMCDIFTADGRPRGRRAWDTRCITNRKEREKQQMSYPRFTLKGINMITKLQGCDLERSFVCKFETSNGSVRHVS